MRQQLSIKEQFWRGNATLTVEGASFPGGEDSLHRLTFRFSRDLVKGGPFGPWHVLLESAQWPAKADTARRFGSRTGTEVSRLGLRSFLIGATGGYEHLKRTGLSGPT